MAGQKKDTKTGLTPLQAKYCQERVKGKTQRQAYKDAGYSAKQSPGSIDSNACILEQKEEIQAHIKHLTDLANNGAILDTKQRQAALYEIYKDDTKPIGARLKALDMLNRMAGDYIEKQQIDANVTGLTREDRRDAMQDTLNALKSAWDKES